jgi:guanylate kinase
MSHLILISAPSGSGKSTVIRQLMQDESLRLSFSISATSRSPRGSEQHGVEYYFCTPEQFKKLIDEDQLVEYVEVYAGKYYGTLRREIERLAAMGRNILFDVDAVGAMRIQEAYRDKVVSIFLMPPSFAELRRRLESRGTETPEFVEERMRRASYEINFAKQFDHIVVNDDLSLCVAQVSKIIRDSINK